MAIKVLGPETAAKLAAGEVVERPSSVVRELVDNALDAGAQTVSVLITNGGMDLIKVVDDGAGMDRADLRTCAERHATSKIEGIEDLSRISSLGFRGEALHSIAAVGRLRIRSRQIEQPGCEVEFDGLRLARETASGCPEGTQVEIRNLFHNTPVRLKFLKSPTAEAARVEQLMRRYVLGRPDVAFRLHVDGREGVRSPGTGDPLDAIAAVYGWRVAESLLKVDAAEAAGEVNGYLSPPSLTRSNRSDMHVYVNGRWVQSRPLLFALQEAYSSLLMVGRFPLCVLHLHVPPDRVDVNVHPAKSDVRFADERGVASLVGRTARNTLLRNSGADDAAATPLDITQFAFRPAAPMETASADLLRASQEHPNGSLDVAHVDSTTDAHEGRLPPLRIVGQLACTYIIAEGPHGMCLVDQHAAHERVLLERLQDGRGAAEESQALLEPVVVPLSPVQAERAEEWVRELASLGFAVETFGDQSLLLRSVPAGVPAERAPEILCALEEGLEGLGSAEERRRAMLATLACHSAIRAGQLLDTTEMRRLIQDLERTRVPTACAHGRPTLLEISRLDLEREFGRRGSR